MQTNERLIEAVQLATRKLASSGNYDLLLRDVLAMCVQAVGASGGTIYIHDPATRRLRFRHVIPSEITDRLPSRDIAEDFGLAGEAFTTRKSVCREFPPKPDSDRTAFEQATGVTVRSIVAVPLTMEDETPIGVVQILNKEEGAFNETDVAVLDTVAAVATMGYLNARLSEESSRASSLLGMGKVSHDIGNLAASLYSTLGSCDYMMSALKEKIGKKAQRVELDYLAESIGESLGDLKNSIDRIVGYSRLISDISAGRALRPTMTVISMAETIETSAAYLEPEARANHVELMYDVHRDSPATLHDELYVFRIVQNLVGNAIKAVRETIPDDWLFANAGDPEAVYGRVNVHYRYSSGKHFLEVIDTGPGMTREVADRILSGNARSEWDKGSGSGLGTKIVLELALTHQAKVEIESTLGQGSMFRVTFPHTSE